MVTLPPVSASSVVLPDTLEMAAEAIEPMM